MGTAVILQNKTPCWNYLYSKRPPIRISQFEGHRGKLWMFPGWAVPHCLQEEHHGDHHQDHAHCSILHSKGIVCCVCLDYLILAYLAYKGVCVSSYYLVICGVCVKLRIYVRVLGFFDAAHCEPRILQFTLLKSTVDCRQQSRPCMRRRL